MNQTLHLGFDREADLDRQVRELLFGKQEDVRPWPLTDEQRRLLHILQWHKGEGNAITIATLRGKMKLGEREIKEAVRGLIVDYRLPVVGLRRPPYGYFLALTPEEVREAARTLHREVIELCRRIRALDSGYLQEMLGQIPMELDKEDKAS